MSQPVLTGRATASSGRWVHSREPRNLNITEPFPDILVSRQKSAIRASMLSRRAHLRWLSHAQRKVFFPIMSKGVMGDPVTLQYYHLRQGKVSPRGMLLRTAGITSALEIICYSHLTSWVLALSLFHIFLCTQAVKQTILRWCVIHLLMLCTATGGGGKTFKPLSCFLGCTTELSAANSDRDLWLFPHFSSSSAYTHFPPSTTRTCRACGTGTSTTWRFWMGASSFAWTPNCACQKFTRCGKKRAARRSQRRRTSGSMVKEPAVSIFPKSLMAKGWHIWLKKKN